MAAATSDESKDDMNKVSRLQLPQVSELALQLPAMDGYQLAASEFGTGAQRPVVLIAPSVGVTRDFYRAFAIYLAQRGFSAVTWDWRGVGESRADGPTDLPVALQDWGCYDLAGVIAWAREYYGGLPVAVVAHGVGGQVLGFAPNADGLAAVVTVSAASSYLGHYPAASKLLFALAWYAGLPLGLRPRGYMPARRLAGGDGPPAGVVRQWARWSRSPNYLDEYRLHWRVTAPLLAFSFEDDLYAPRRAVEALHREYRSRELVRRHLAPVDLGVNRVGHYGFFEPSMAPRLWAETAAWLSQRMVLSATRGRQASPPPLRIAV